MEVSLHETAIAQETVYEARRHRAVVPTDRPFTLRPLRRASRGRPSFSKATWKRRRVRFGFDARAMAAFVFFDVVSARP